MRRPFRVHRRWLTILTVLTLIMSIPAIAPTPATAAGPIVVGEGGCTLVDAITAANTDTATGGCPAGDGADTIVLEADATYDVVTPTESDPTSGLLVTSDLIIQGNGATIQRGRGAANFRVLRQHGGNLTLDHLTLADGHPYVDGVPMMGGCIYSIGTLRIVNSTITGCKVDYSGSAIFSLSGQLIIEGSTFYNNFTNIFNWGGVIHVGLQDQPSTATITNTTVSNNSSVIGIWAQGTGSTVQLDNATIVSPLVGSTATGNGGVALGANSILEPPPFLFDGSVFHDLGGNLLTADPLLAGLADNGGPTLTRLPMAGSPAIEAGQSTCQARDQRGINRPQGLRCDSGAVEVVDDTAPVITPQVSGSLGLDGWYSDVVVAWEVVESVSRVTSASGCDATAITDDTAGTTFTCTATSVGGTASASVTIKRDGTAPVIQPLANQTLDPVSTDGALVHFAAQVTDNLSSAGSIAATCVDQDGDAFTSGQVAPVGTTTITCTATDLAGNSAGQSFTVTVRSPGDLLAELQANTLGLVHNTTAQRALVATLAQARQGYETGNTWRVYTSLLMYVIQLDQYVDRRTVTPAAAQQLAFDARTFLSVIM
jgi:hypothetical protein